MFSCGPAFFMGGAAAAIYAPKPSTKWRLTVTANNGRATLSMAEVWFRTSAGATMGAGTASASTVFDTTTYTAAKAADRNASTYWSTATSTPTGWWQFDFTVAQSITHYDIQIRSDATDAAPKDWTLSYWNDTEWIPVDARTNQTGWALGETRSFAVSQMSGKQLWCLDITNASGYILARDFQFREVAGTAQLFSGGGALATSENSGNVAPNAADNLNTHWQTANGTTSARWKYFFSSPKEIRQYTVQASSEPAYAPLGFSLQYWNGIAWVTVDTRSNQTGWVAAEVRTYTVSP